uniref:Uncharacterized protein n=1 Tax=viral metagenome TaxID=1070528 RepID=A0A6M3ILL0_9ZZZZ
MKETLGGKDENPRGELLIDNDTCRIANEMTVENGNQTDRTPTPGELNALVTLGELNALVSKAFLAMGPELARRYEDGQRRRHTHSIEMEIRYEITPGCRGSRNPPPGQPPEPAQLEIETLQIGEVSFDPCDVPEKVLLELERLLLDWEAE